MYLNGIHVFPLVKANGHLNGYFIDVNGNVYSNKSRSGVPALTKLMGSKQPSGHYYTLNKLSFRADVLLRTAKAHPEFIRETAAYGNGTSPTAVLATGLPMGRTKSASEAVSKKGFVLATVGPTDRFVFGTDPVLHTSETTAREEAVRIANLKPGTEVVILKAVASVVAGGTVWK